MEIQALKTYLPCLHFEESIDFYTKIGFTIHWQSDLLAELGIGSFRFLLQRFEKEEFAKNFMMLSYPL